MCIYTNMYIYTYVHVCVCVCVCVFRVWRLGFRHLLGGGIRTPVGNTNYYYFSSTNYHYFTSTNYYHFTSNNYYHCTSTNYYYFSSINYYYFTSTNYYYLLGGGIRTPVGNIVGDIIVKERRVLRNQRHRLTNNNSHQ